MFNTIVLAVDGSDHSRAATAVAADLAAKYSSKLVLVNVPEPMTDPMMAGYAVLPNEQLTEAIEKAAREVLDEATDALSAKGLKNMESVIANGDPATELVRAAEKHGADLIVLGRRGLGAVSRLLVGSTTTKVAQLADCAVLTVK